MHSWTVLVLATTAAFLAGALFASAGPRLGASVAIATAVHGRGPSNAGWHLRSLFQEATGLPETPRIQGKSPYGLFYRDANQTSVPPFGQELCASLVYGLCIAHIHTQGPYNGSASDLTTLSSLNESYFPRSTAVMHTALYAARHGYSYRYVIAPWDPDSDRYATWAKIPQVYALLKEFRYAVIVDPDAYFAKPDVPLHLLMGRWGWKPHSSLLFAEDPPWPQNWDSHNRTTLNFGFIVAQNTPLTMKTLKDLYAAPDAIEGAELWKLNWSHEQRTFSDYFRDGFAEGEDLVIASCADANDAMVQYCNGTFVTHLWGRKDEVNDRMLGSILRDFLLVLEEHVERSGFVVNATSSDISLMR